MTESSAAPRVDPLDEPVSRRRAAFWHLALRYASLVLVMVRTLALVPLLVSALGEEEYGAWLASGAVLMQLSSTNFGFLGVLAQRVAAAYGQRNRDLIERLLGTGLVTALALTALLAILSAAAAPLFPPLYGIEGEMARRLVLVFILTAVANGIQLFGFAVSSLLESFQRTVFSGIQQLVAELLSLACTVWLVLEGWGLYAIAWGLILRALWSASANGLRCLWLFRRTFRLRLSWDGGLFRSLWSSSLHFFVMQIMNWARLSLDRPLVGLTLGPAAALVYSITMQAHEMIRLLVLTVGAASNAGLAHLFGEGYVARFKRIIAVRYEIQAAAAAIGLGGVLAFNESFIQLWTGPGLYAGHLVNTLAAIVTGSFILTTVPYDGLQARGEFPLLSKALCAETAVRLPLMYGLLLTMGMTGAPLGSTITQTLMLLLPLAVFLGRSLGQPPRELAGIGLEISRLILPVMGASGAALAFLPRPAGWLTLVLQAAAFTGAAVLIIAALNPPLIRFLLSRGRDPDEVVPDPTA